MELTPELIKFALDENLNLLVESTSGTGKSTIILEELKKHKINFKYFSAALIDPFIELTGIPFSVKSNEKTYIDYALPKGLEDVEVFFIDEYNRAPKKTLQCLMELVQWKSINGRKLPKLKCVFAAINPYDADNEEYNVEYMDLAQADRFQLRVKMESKINFEFFEKKYGKKIATAACDYYNKLPKEIRSKVLTPRRVEYGLDVWLKGGSLRWVFPETETNISSLEKQLADGSYVEQMQTTFQSRDEFKAKKQMQDQNFYFNTRDDIFQDKEKIEFFLPLISAEEMTALLSNDTRIHKYIEENLEDFKNIFCVRATNKVNYNNLPSKLKTKLLQNNKKIKNKKDDLAKVFNDKYAKLDTETQEIVTY
jgi:hypothetical protein